jgi:hypothetical protein
MYIAACPFKTIRPIAVVDHVHDYTEQVDKLTKRHRTLELYASYSLVDIQKDTNDLVIVNPDMSIQFRAFLLAYASAHAGAKIFLVVDTFDKTRKTVLLDDDEAEFTTNDDYAFVSVRGNPKMYTTPLFFSGSKACSFSDPEHHHLCYTNVHACPTSPYSSI